MFGTKNWKPKSLTNSRDFYPDPPNEELKSSVFWMNWTILNIFVIFWKKAFFSLKKVMEIG